MASDSVHRNDRSTYVNFSTPQRIMRPKTASGKRTGPTLESVDEDGELRSYKFVPRPIKPTRFLQLRVTSNDLNGRSSDAEAKSEDPGLGKTTVGQRILDMSDRTTAVAASQASIMPGSSSQQTWPKKYQEKKAGSYNFGDFGEVPTLTKTPWELHRAESKLRRQRASSRSSVNLPRRIFEQLPPEINQCILDQLEAVHSSGPMINITTLQTDLLSLCRVDRQWNRVTREYMYRDIWLPSNFQPKKKRFSFQTPKSKLQMLLETLKKSPFLATLVLRLRVTVELAAVLDTEIHQSTRGPTLQTLSDIVQVCPNLEHVSGYVPSVGPVSMSLVGVLSTRSYLRSHAWNLDPNRTALPNLGEFISAHDEWSHLDTLALSADVGVDLGVGSFSAVLQKLPSLKHLMLSGVHPADFNDATLFTLPGLKTLRLENLTGLTDQGVEQLAFSRLAPSLQRLALIGLELLSLQTVHTLLSHITRLKYFVFTQESSPEPLHGIDDSGNALVLGSPSLQHLHWDCVMQGAATLSFADAIVEGRFPVLRSVRVPCDYDGLIQALCRPIPQVEPTVEDLAYLAKNKARKTGRSMRLARLQAQQRSLQSRNRPAINVVVQDETNEVQHEHFIGSYLGSMESSIEYLLDSEVGDAALPSLQDIVRPKGSTDASGTWEQKVDLGLLF